MKAEIIDHRHRSRGHRWRVHSDDRGKFDEIVVVTGRETRPRRGMPARQSGLILHAEMMNDQSCFVDVAGVCIWVHVGRDGIARITMAEDRRTELVASEADWLRDPKLDAPKARARRKGKR